MRTNCVKRILMVVHFFEIVDGVSRLSSSVTCEQLKVIMFLCMDNSCRVDRIHLQ
jgi:hypothetical protein